MFLFLFVVCCNFQNAFSQVDVVIDAQHITELNKINGDFSDIENARCLVAAYQCLDVTQLRSKA